MACTVMAYIVVAYIVIAQAVMACCLQADQFRILKAYIAHLIFIFRGDATKGLAMKSRRGAITI